MKKINMIDRHEAIISQQTAVKPDKHHYNQRKQAVVELLYNREYALTVFAMRFSMANGLSCLAHVDIEINCFRLVPFALLTFHFLLQKKKENRFITNSE